MLYIFFFQLTGIMALQGKGKMQDGAGEPSGCDADLTSSLPALQ